MDTLHRVNAFTAGGLRLSAETPEMVSMFTIASGAPANLLHYHFQQNPVGPLVKVLTLDVDKIEQKVNVGSLVEFYHALNLKNEKTGYAQYSLQCFAQMLTTYSGSLDIVADLPIVIPNLSVTVIDNQRIVPVVTKVEDSWSVGYLGMGYMLSRPLYIANLFQ